MPPNRIERNDRDPHRIQPPEPKKGKKVEKVREVDPDEQARKKFRRYMEEEEEPSPPSAPGPFDPTFYFTDGKTTSKIGDSSDPSNWMQPATPTPSNSPPPNLSTPSPTEPPPEEASPLPSSSAFWEHVDAPPDRPPPPIHCQEKESSPPKKPSPQEKGKETSKEDLLVVSTPWTPPVQTPPSLKEEKKPPASRSVSPSSEKATPLEEPLPIEQTSFSRETRDSLFKEKKKETTETAFLPTGSSQAKGEIQAPSSTPIPPAALPVATAATSAASPYLSPEVLPIFFQMIGTIVAMTSRGVSETEFTLNHPSFAQSKFFGATITVQKYATAPDSLNIRLSGSNEAVTAFNQSIPSLYNAFQAGSFSFRIGRIDAVYATERPLFRRKRSAQDAGSEFEGENS